MDGLDTKYAFISVWVINPEGQKIVGFFMKPLCCGDRHFSAVYDYSRTAILLPYGEPRMRKITKYMLTESGHLLQVPQNDLRSRQGWLQNH